MHPVLVILIIVAVDGVSLYAIDIHNSRTTLKFGGLKNDDNDIMMMMIMVRHMTSVVNRDLAPNALTWNQAKLGKEGFCKRSFLSLVYPHKTMAAQARYTVDQGNCPCLTSGRTAKDSNTDSPRPG